MYAYEACTQSFLMLARAFRYREQCSFPNGSGLLAAMVSTTPNVIAIATVIAIAMVIASEISTAIASEIATAIASGTAFPACARVV